MYTDGCSCVLIRGKTTLKSKKKKKSTNGKRNSQLEQRLDNLDML